MHNKVTFAAAGSGKTYSICSQAIALASHTKKTILLVTYTNEGVNALEQEYRKQNYGVIDENVRITTWYSFLLSDCVKPYQCLLKLKFKRNKEDIPVKIPENYVKSIAFYQNEVSRYYSKCHLQYFLNRAKDVAKDRVSELAYVCNEDSEGKVIQRLENIYSHMFFDELQDFAGWDLEILLLLFASKIQINCVGDHKQATFRTNNSLKNKQYRDDKIIDFFSLHEKKGLCSIDFSNVTRRFNSQICNYINTIYNSSDSSVCQCENLAFSNDNIGVYIIDSKYMEIYCNYYTPIVLRYNKESKIKFIHNCRVLNYGGSKGCTFERVVVVPVSTVEPFIKNGSPINSSQTKAKFYVACTRARNSVVFVVDKFKENDLFLKTSLKLGDIEIPAFKYKDT